MENLEEYKLEKQKMARVSELIREVKPYYKKRRSSFNNLKVACILALALFGGLTFEYFNQNPDLIEILVYGDILYPEDLGFPTDSYGFIMVD